MRLKKFEKSLKGAIYADDLRSLFSICIGEDNQGCIADAQQGYVADLSKHVDVKYQFIVNHVKQGHIDIKYVATDIMVLDMLAKNLRSTKLLILVRMAAMS